MKVEIFVPGLDEPFFKGDVPLKAPTNVAGILVWHQPLNVGAPILVRVGGFESRDITFLGQEGVLNVYMAEVPPNYLFEPIAVAFAMCC